MFSILSNYFIEIKGKTVHLLKSGSKPTVQNKKRKKHGEPQDIIDYYQNLEQRRQEAEQQMMLPG